MYFVGESGGLGRGHEGYLNRLSGQATLSDLCNPSCGMMVVLCHSGRLSRMRGKPSAHGGKYARPGCRMNLLHIAGDDYFNDMADRRAW